MIRKQIYLPDQINKRLTEISEKRGVSQAELIREGMEMYLSTVDDKEKKWDQLLDQMKHSKLKNLAWNREREYQQQMMHRGKTDEQRTD